MWVFIFLTTLLTVNAGIIKKECNGVTGYMINGVFHEPEIMRDGLDRPYLLTVDHSNNIVYFSYSINDDEDGSKTARLNLNTKEFGDIKGINNGFAQTVDQVTHTVYIGGSDGIYTYDYGQDNAEYMAEKDTNIWTMYFSHGVLYFSVYPSQFLYTHALGKTERFKDLEDTKVDSFVIGIDQVMFYTNATGLYSKILNEKESILYQEFKDYSVRGLTIDNNGKVYACYQDGIYFVDRSAKNVTKILDIEDAFGVAFDIDNNIVYSDSSSVVRLKPSKNIKTC